jgi:hypothetical protein
MIRKKPKLRRSSDRSTWLRGGEIIAAALGVDRKHLPELVSKHELPAFKYLGRWTLITEDLPTWMQKIKRHHYHGPKTRKRRPAPTGRKGGPP